MIVLQKTAEGEILCLVERKKPQAKREQKQLSYEFF